MRTPRIFISYSHVDAALAVRLAEDLRRSDIDVWIDEWRVNPGDDIRREVEEALATYDHFGILLTPDSLSSEWVQSELTAALVRQLDRRGTIVVPLKAKPCEPPPLLAGKKWIDLARDYDRGFAQLLAFLRRDTGEPSAGPFPRHYLDLVINDTEYLESPLLSLISPNRRIPLRRVFTTLSALSTSPRAREDILLREESERAIRASLSGRDSADSNMMERAIIARLKESPSEVDYGGAAVPLLDVMERHSALVLLGQPGAGKSTMLRYFASACARTALADSDRPQRIPFLITMADLAEGMRSGRDLSGTLTRFMSARYGLDAANGFQTSCESGTALVLLDGLDEAGTAHDRTRTVVAIQRFAAEAIPLGNRLVVTSRLVGYRTHRPLSDPFVHYAIAGLNKAKAEELIALVLAEATQDSSTPRQSLEEHLTRISRCPGADLLMASPLTATMLCCLSASSAWPRTKTELFRIVTDLQASEWDTLSGRSPSSTKEATTCALAGMASWLTNSRVSGLFTFEEAVAATVNALVESHLATRVQATQLSPQLFSHIASSSGLVVEKSTGLFGFALRSFQDYYTARQLIDAGDNLIERVLSWRHEPKYLEVLPYAVGLASLFYPHLGEELVDRLLVIDDERASPLHQSTLTALRSASEIAAPTEELTSRLARALSNVLLNCQALPLDGDTAVYRPMMFAPFREKVRDAMSQLAAYARASEIVAHVMIDYRMRQDAPGVPRPETGGTYVCVDPEEFSASASKIRALNVLEMAGWLAKPSPDVLDIIDEFLASGDDELKKAAVQCGRRLYERLPSDAVLERLRRVALDDSIAFEYQNFKSDAITSLCALDVQEPVFLARLRHYLEHETTFQSYAVVAGLPAMTDTAEVRDLFSLALASKNLAVSEDFIRATATSGRVNVPSLQARLVEVVERKRSDDLTSLALTALAMTDVMEMTSQERLLGVVYDGERPAWVRMRAAHCLRNGRSSLSQMAMKAVADRDPVLRFAGVCLAAAGGVLEQQIVSPLIELAKNDLDDQVRSDAYRLLRDHGYSNTVVDEAVLQSALETGWGSGILQNAMKLAADGGVTASIQARLNENIDGAAARHRTELDPSNWPGDMGWPRTEKLGFCPEGEEQIAYRSALLLAQSGSVTTAGRAILKAAICHPSNFVRGRVYQEYGLGQPVAPLLVTLLLQAVGEEGETLVGGPSLWTTLDRIGPLSLEGLVAALETCESSEDADTCGFCCQLLAETVVSGKLVLSEQMLRRSYFAVASAMCGPMFRGSSIDLTEHGKMHNRMFRALVAVGQLCGPTAVEFDKAINYPWRQR